MTKRNTKSVEQQVAELNAAVAATAAAKRAAKARKALGLESPRTLFGCVIANIAPGVYAVTKDGAEVGRATDGYEAQNIARANW